VRKVRWGVIGAGGIADRKTIPGLLAADNCELVAVMDIVNAEKIANKYQVKHYTDSIEELLARQDVDAVYNCYACGLVSGVGQVCSSGRQTCIMRETPGCQL